MLSRLNAAWMEDGAGDGASWARANPGPGAGLGEAKDETGLAGFKSMLDDDWYLNPSSAPQQPCVEPLHAPPHEPMLLPPPMDSSSSCSTLDPSPPPFFTSRPPLSSLLGAMCSNPFELGFEPAGFLQSPQLANSHVLLSRGGSDLGFSGPSAQIGGLDFGTSTQFSAGRLLPPPPPETGSSSGSAMGFNPLSFDCFESPPFLNRSKVLRPLEVFPPVGAQPTLFQKRAAALRQNSAMGVEIRGALGLLSGEGSLGTDSHEKGRRGSEEDDGEEASFDGSGLNYDSDEAMAAAAEDPREENTKGGGGGAGNANSTLTGGGGDAKGKKKGLPAKNLMAERRRRKKLNDRLYMLRSVVPKISKMDRASILGDAIEYLKELLQRINDLHNELESTPSSSLPNTATTSFHPLTPTPPTLPCRVKEELCPSSLSSPNNQQARVEVRVREGRAVNIHMFCARRPGLLLSTMRALEGLGLDIQQAVISCFNGFALDVFRAEQCKDGPGVLPEEIKSVLLHSAGFQGTM